MHTHGFLKEAPEMGKTDPYLRRNVNHSLLFGRLLPLKSCQPPPCLSLCPLIRAVWVGARCFLHLDVNPEEKLPRASRVVTAPVNRNAVPSSEASLAPWQPQSHSHRLPCFVLDSYITSRLPVTASDRVFGAQDWCRQRALNSTVFKPILPK